jgi:hypothetical protein
MSTVLFKLILLFNLYSDFYSDFNGFLNKMKQLAKNYELQC